MTLKSLVKWFLLAMICTYLGCGMMMASIAKRYVPATSWLGWTYITLTWPCWVPGSPLPAPPILPGAVNFKEDAA